MSAIPASQIVNVNPGVVGAGGSALDLIGLMLTSSTRVPLGQVLSFPTANAVGAYFGGASQEHAEAVVYFAGFDNANAVPAAMLFTQYPVASVASYLRGGATGLTLAQLQALAPGTITVTVQGVARISGSINLSAVASFSAAATAIQTALAAYDAVVTGSITATTLTVTAVTGGALAVGQVISGTGVTAGTTITALGTGTGGIGTYTVSVSQTAASTTVSAGPVTVTYDSTAAAFVITDGTKGVASTIGFASGALAVSLGMTQATGAVTSQGAITAVPGTFMDVIKNTTQNWASFTTMFEPSTGDKVLFAAWTNAQDNRFEYVLWDTDISATQNGNTSSARYLIGQAAYSGTFAIYSPTDQYLGAMVMGFNASIDFTRANDRTNLAFRSQSGMAASVTDATIAANLLANGYNFYGSYATANDVFTWLYNGSVTGPFLWADSYINQIWLNNELQLSLMTLLAQVKSIPYNADGYALMEAAMQDPIDAALNFGAVRAGVTLSNLQRAEVNNAAGRDIASTLELRGWYLLVQDPSPQVRAARGSPPSTFWYTDGQSVQAINLSSLELQ